MEVLKRNDKDFVSLMQRALRNGAICDATPQISYRFLPVWEGLPLDTIVTVADVSASIPHRHEKILDGQYEIRLDGKIIASFEMQHGSRWKIKTLSLFWERPGGGWCDHLNIGIEKVEIDQDDDLQAQRAILQSPEFYSTRNGVFK